MNLRMPRFAALLVLAATPCLAAPHRSAPVPQADAYVPIAGAAFPPTAGQGYKAIFDATRAADAPDHLVPGITMAGDVYNDLAGAGVSLVGAKIAVVFHGAAVNGILDAVHYRAQFGRDNPNLPALRALRQAGAELYVCGQYLVAMKIDPKTLSKDVTVASDAELVLISLQNRGYALMSF